VILRTKLARPAVNVLPGQGMGCDRFSWAKWLPGPAHYRISAARTPHNAFSLPEDYLIKYSVKVLISEMNVRTWTPPLCQAFSS